MGEVVIGVEDPDDDATNDVATCGLAAVIRITMAVHENLHVVLRAGSVELGGDPTSQAAALRLLTAQATVALQNGQLLDEVRKTHAEIAHQAKHDSLTDLANRGHFTEVLAATLERTDVDPHRTTVMFLDLNGFKAVNDRLGHNAGDALLRSVADRIGRAVGSRGMLARLGGDEFTILLVDDEPDAGDRLADQIHARLAVPFDVAGESVTVATSIGISQAEPGIGVSEMLRRSDVAMYSAKKPGKTTRTVRYHVGLDEEERRTEALGRSLAGAIANDELHLLYQPIVTTGDGAIVGTEALIRWDHPLLGPVSPPDILGVAESIDLIDELNAWIVRRAMIDMARCLPRTAVDGIEPFVAINLSPREVELTSLVDNLTAAMDESGLRPSQIVIELSERIAAESLDSIPNVDVLVERGMRLALDDFGQGHTSLAHLRKLPISCLKLDRALVLNADDSVEDRTILRSVVSLARDLGYSVIAEGVETDHQLSIVRSAGAQYVQGFGLHRPMRVGELQELLDRATWDPLGHPIDLAGERDDLDHPDHHDPDGHGSEGHGSDHLDDVPGELISVGATTTARNGANSISPGRPTPGAGGTQHNTQSPAVADLGVETQPRPAERNEADSSTGAQTTSTDPASRPAFGPTIQSSIRERPAVFPPPAPTARDAG
jgi:diguanylate cyclase (GGDEF)-like protein